nr:putative protein TPRXL [Salvelinus alpinus]
MVRIKPPATGHSPEPPATGHSPEPRSPGDGTQSGASTVRSPMGHLPGPVVGAAGVENDKPTRTVHSFAENDEPPFADSSSEEGKPEESKPCTSTDDDRSLAGQEQVVAPGLATPPNNAGEDPTILDPDSDSSLPIPDDSGGAAAKSDSQTTTKNIKDPANTYRTTGGYEAAHHCGQASNGACVDSPYR